MFWYNSHSSVLRMCFLYYWDCILLCYVSLYTVIAAIVLFKLNLESLEIVMELNTTVLFEQSYFIVVQGYVVFVVSCILWLVYILSMTRYFYFHVSLDCIFLVYVLLSSSFLTWLLVSVIVFCLVIVWVRTNWTIINCLRFLSLTRVDQCIKGFSLISFS